MARKRTGQNTLSYLGVEALTPPQFEAYPRSPTDDDFYNHNIGTLWLDTVKLTAETPTIPAFTDVYMLVAKSGTTASWISFDTITNIETLTGDSGGAITPDGFRNIDVLGTASLIVSTGSPGTNTLTLDIGDGVADEYNTDSGAAVPALNTLNIVGGTYTDTSGAGSTVTINMADAVGLQYTSDSGIATPSSNNLNVFGGEGVDTSGATDTITVSISGDVSSSYVSDSGTATPAANTLKVLGGTAMDTSGLGSTITVNMADAVGLQYTSDSGIATPASNNLNVLGGTGVNTSGATDTLTVAINDDIATTYTTDSGTATPATNNVNILGGASIDTSGVGSTVTVTQTALVDSPAFAAYLIADIVNVVGDVSDLKVAFDKTEFDTNSDFDTGNNYFVAPYDGIYYFTANVFMYKYLTTSMTSGNVAFVVNSGPPTYQKFSACFWNPVPIRDLSVGLDEIDFPIAAYIVLSAADTVEVQVTLANGAGNTADIGALVTQPKDYRSWFHGSLVYLS